MHNTDKDNRSNKAQPQPADMPDKVQPHTDHTAQQVQDLGCTSVVNIHLAPRNGKPVARDQWQSSPALQSGMSAFAQDTECLDDRASLTHQ